MGVNERCYPRQGDSVQAEEDARTVRRLRGRMNERPPSFDAPFEARKDHDRRAHSMSMAEFEAYMRHVKRIEEGTWPRGTA